MNELIHLNQPELRNYKYHAALFASSSASEIIPGISPNIKYFASSNVMTYSVTNLVLGKKAY